MDYEPGPCELIAPERVPRATYPGEPFASIVAGAASQFSQAADALEERASELVDAQRIDLPAEETAILEPGIRALAATAAGVTALDQMPTELALAIAVDEFDGHLGQLPDEHAVPEELPDVDNAIDPPGEVEYVEREPEV